MKTRVCFFIISVFLISCEKEDSKYPVELKIIDINKGEIKAYTKTDSIIPNNYTYASIDEHDLFGKFLLKGITFKSYEKALLIYGDFEPNDDIKDSLKLNASVSYKNDSVFFSVNEEVDGMNLLFTMPGIGNETSLVFNGTEYVIFYPYGLDGFIIYESFKLEALRTELGLNDTLVYFHFTLIYK